MAKRKSAGAVGGVSGVSGLSLTALHAELRRRERVAGRLLRRRERLISKLKELDAQIADAGGNAGHGFTAAGVVRKRPKNDSNLVEALAKLLKGKTMSVTDAAEAVQAAGYQTTSASFRTIVNQTLIKSNKFKKVSRGQYTAA